MEPDKIAAYGTAVLTIIGAIALLIRQHQRGVVALEKEKAEHEFKLNIERDDHDAKLAEQTNSHDEMRRWRDGLVTRVGVLEGLIEERERKWQERMELVEAREERCQQRVGRIVGAIVVWQKTGELPNILEIDADGAN